MISAFQIVLTLTQFCSNYMLIVRWFRDNPKRGSANNPRAIQVGIPLEGSAVIDRHTGVGEGMAVPEADRDVNKQPIYYEKKKAIPAFPIVDEEGKEVEDEVDPEAFF